MPAPAGFAGNLFVCAPLARPGIQLLDDWTPAFAGVTIGMSTRVARTVRESHIADNVGGPGHDG